MEKNIFAIQLNWVVGLVISVETEKNEDVGSMCAYEMVTFDYFKNLDASFVSKQCQNSETSIQMQPQTMLPG